MLGWWMLMGATLFMFFVALTIADNSAVRCSWCGDGIPEGHDSPFRRVYRFHTLEQTMYGVDYYCSEGCLRSHRNEADHE